MTPTPEKWNRNGLDIELDGVEVAQLNGYRDDAYRQGDRIVSCLSACRGIPDPAAAIKAARAYIEKQSCINKPCYVGDNTGCVCGRKEALALLGGQDAR